MMKFQHPIKYVDFIIWFIIHPIYVSFMGIFKFPKIVDFDFKNLNIKIGVGAMIEKQDKKFINFREYLECIENR